jgi:FMN phosphatase YigB (HAD superfamily)
MKKIKFIYFDVGGVAVIDFTASNKWNDMLMAMGIDIEAKKEQFEMIWKKYRPRVCIDYDVDWMIDEIRQELGLDLPQEFSLLAEFVNRFEKNESIWPVVEFARQNYRIGLLTNMYVRMFDLIVKRNILPPVEFDEIIDSSFVQCKKPDMKIYTIAQERAKIQSPHEILFIENDASKLELPKQLGWQTFYYDTALAKEYSHKLMSLLEDNKN